MKKRLVDLLLGRKQMALDLQRGLTAIPALGPENKGQGEADKAAYIVDWLKSWGIKPEIYGCPDTRAPSGSRPNLTVFIKGELESSLCLFAHMDVVPPGDMSLWETDPWQAICKGDDVYGRGVEDNQQALVSMLLLGQAIRELEAKPRLGLKLFFVADEECGSQKGLGWLLEAHPELFGSQDLYVVPDGGSPKGNEIEIAEKAQIWLKFTVTGKQSHASMPGAGVNAFVAMSGLVLALAELGKQFPQKNDLFMPPYSTFVPTRHEENVEGINILPGREIFYLDCRILPQTPVAKILTKIRELCAEIERSFAVTVEMEEVQRQAATQTSPDSLVVKALSRAIEEIYAQKPALIGIGGATVAALLRKRGFPAAVWSCIKNTCHQPNEHSSLTATLKDAAVFASMLYPEKALIDAQR